MEPKNHTIDFLFFSFLVFLVSQIFELMFRNVGTYISIQSSNF
jgi:hypothetical protein